MDVEIDSVVNHPELEKMGTIMEVSWGTIDGELAAFVQFCCAHQDCDDWHNTFMLLDAEVPALFEWQKVLYSIPEMLRMTILQIHGEAFEWYNIE